MSYSFIEAIKDLATGKAEFVTQPVYLSRLESCSKCTSFAKLTKQCRECGCFVHSKAKFKKSICPQNKWKNE